MNLKDLDNSNFPAYYQKYIDYLPNEELLKLLVSHKEEMLQFLKGLSSQDLFKSYGEGKWTVAEVLLHLIDTERIFQYRALRIARKDQTPLAGYDQDAYVPAANANDRDHQSLVSEYTAVRNATISLFENFSPKMLQEKGTSNGGPLSSAAAGFIIVGHEKHHLLLFKSHYGL